MSEPKPIEQVRPYRLVKGGWYEWSDERAEREEFDLPDELGRVFRETFPPITLFEYDPRSLYGGIERPQYTTASYRTLPEDRTDENGYARLTPADQPAIRWPQFVREWYDPAFDATAYSEAYFAECRPGYADSETGRLRRDCLAHIKAERDLLESELLRAGERVAAHARSVERILKAYLCESILGGKRYAEGLVGGTWESFVMGHNFNDKLDRFNIGALRERLIEDGTHEELSERTFKGISHYIRLRDSILSYAVKLEIRLAIVEWVLFYWYTDQPIPEEAPELRQPYRTDDPNKELRRQLLECTDDERRVWATATALDVLGTGGQVEAIYECAGSMLRELDVANWKGGYIRSELTKFLNHRYNPERNFNRPTLKYYVEQAYADLELVGKVGEIGSFPTK